MAALKVDDADATVRRKAASGAKVPDRQVGQVLRPERGADAWRHGASPTKLAVSHYFKRLTMIDLMFGNQQHHLTRYANLSMAA